MQTEKQTVEEIGILPVITLVLWVLCALIGVLGMMILVPAKPAAPPPVPPATQATLLDLDITDLVPPPEETPAPDDQPQPIASDVSPETPPPGPPPPPPAMVAASSPLIAFAQPIEGPVRIVTRQAAAPTRPLAQNPQAPNTIVSTPLQATHLTFGEGAGVQSKPEYPEEAKLAHQQGTVVVRFHVDENGQVKSAEVSSPSPFPLLNQAALCAVRDAWQFPTGPPRYYEVSIVFSLKPH